MFYMRGKGFFVISGLFFSVRHFRKVNRYDSQEMRPLSACSAVGGANGNGSGQGFW